MGSDGGWSLAVDNTEGTMMIIYYLWPKDQTKQKAALVLPVPAHDH